jgi:alpha-glucosidase
MVDPIVAKVDNEGSNNGVDLDVFHKDANGSFNTGVVWPGPTVFPDWFHPFTQQYWDNEFLMFFDPDTGVDIDELWINMNEAANFCDWPCSNPVRFAEETGNPLPLRHVRNNSGRSIAGFPLGFQPSVLLEYRSPHSRQPSGTSTWLGLPGRDLITPRYEIGNAAGSISNKTIVTDYRIIAEHISTICTTFMVR